MIKDTRDRNEYFNKDTLSQYFLEYSGALADALLCISRPELDKAYLTLRSARITGRKVFVGGNGGSAAISDHLTCDFTKGVKTKTSQPINVISLCSSHALHSAIANDMGYEKTLSYQLELGGIGLSDILILISSSGNSANIIEAADYAINKGAYVIGLTGFDGGELQRVADIKLHVAVNNYGIVEDCHQTLMHVLAQYIYLND